MVMCVMFGTASDDLFGILYMARLNIAILLFVAHEVFLESKAIVNNCYNFKLNMNTKGSLTKAVTPAAAALKAIASVKVTYIYWVRVINSSKCSTGSYLLIVCAKPKCRR